MLHVDLTQSRYLAAVLMTVHAVALAALVPIQLDIAVTVGLGAAIASSLVHALARHAFLRTPHAIASLELENGDVCTLHERNGTVLSAEILGTTYVTPMLTVLNLRPEGSRFARHVVVVRDNVDAEVFRQLRVILRWARGRERRSAAV